MKRLIMLFALSLFSLSALADCLSVGEQSLTLDDSQAGAAHVYWQAELKNQCNRAQDAMLTVQFLDAEGDTVYEVSDQLVIERMGSVKAGREVYVPTTHAARIVDLRIQVEARERPF